jgi:hypothetical protein
MAHDLVRRRLLVGRTKASVRALLGPPDIADGVWTYELTPRIGADLPDFLELHFAKARVASANTALAGAP